MSAFVFRRLEKTISPTMTARIARAQTVSTMAIPESPPQAVRKRGGFSMILT
jgi:hypothetical protein